MSADDRRGYDARLEELRRPAADPRDVPALLRALDLRIVRHRLLELIEADELTAERLNQGERLLLRLHELTRDVRS